MATFAVGDRVVRNPATWQPNDFDSWGRGVGVGVVIEPPFPLGPDEADVRWPGGRCFEQVAQLLLAPPEPDDGPSAATLDPAASPLFSAVERGQIEEIRRLIAGGADVNADWGAGWSPLVHAIDVESDSAWQRHQEPGRESTELTELLLSLGAVPTEEAFAIARRYQNQKVIALLEKHRSLAEPDLAPGKAADTGSRTA